jgi:hypothetical protein
MERKIPWGHLRFAKVTDQALLTSVGHEVRAVVERCTERRLGRKKFPKSFFSGLEIRRGDHLKPVQDWLQPLLDEDFGEEGLPFSFRSKWFRRETWTRKQGSRVLEYVVYFPRIPRWMLEFGYRRHYHTHCWVPDGAVLTEKDHIRGYLSVNNAWDLLHGRFYANRSYDMSLDRTHFLEAISFREALEEAELFYRDVDDFLNISDNATCRTSQTAHGSGQKKPNLSCTRTPPVVVHP